MSGNNRKSQFLTWFSTVSLLTTLTHVAVPLFAFGIVDGSISGPETTLKVASPEGQYLAYANESPSRDPPNQSLLIERKDQSRFLPIAKLGENIDSIKEITWSPGSSFTIFQSHQHLTATRISNWQTTRIYLGKEWRPHKPTRRSALSGGQPHHVVTDISFPESGYFSYRLKNDDKIHSVRIDFYRYLVDSEHLPARDLQGLRPFQPLRQTLGGIE